MCLGVWGVSSSRATVACMPGRWSVDTESVCVPSCVRCVLLLHTLFAPYLYTLRSRVFPSLRLVACWGRSVVDAPCFASNYVQVGLIVIPHAQLGCLELFNPCAVPCWGLSRD